MLDKFFKLIEKVTPAKWHWALNHDGYKRYFENTSWMFGGKMFSLLISFFVGAWIARYLGPENYGIFSYAVAFAGLFGFISFLGIDNLLNRELIQFPERRDELLGTAFYLKITGGIIAFFLATLSAILFQADLLVRLLIILFSFSFVLQSAGVIGIYFQAEVKAKYNFKVLLFSSIISSLLKIIIIALNKGVIWLIIVFVLDFLWQGIGFINVYKNYGLKIKDWKFNKDLARDMMKNSWPLMLASSASIILLKVDQVMIGFFLGNHGVGLYAAAVKLVEVWYFVPSIICVSLFPAIINAKKTSSAMYYNRLKNLYILMTIIPIVMAIPITLFAKPIIYILFGNGYLESVNILRIYIWSSLGIFLSYAVNQYLMSENFVKTIFWLSFCAMAVNIVLNLIFIPNFGLLGAAWATLISYMIVPLGVLIIKTIRI